MPNSRPCRTVTGQVHRAARGTTHAPARSEAARLDDTPTPRGDSFQARTEQARQRYENALRAVVTAVVALDGLSEQEARSRAEDKVRGSAAGAARPSTWRGSPSNTRTARSARQPQECDAIRALAEAFRLAQCGHA